VGNTIRPGLGIPTSASAPPNLAGSPGELGLGGDPGLPPVGDRFDDIRSENNEAEQAVHIGAADPKALRASASRPLNASSPAITLR